MSYVCLCVGASEYTCVPVCQCARVLKVSLACAALAAAKQRIKKLERQVLLLSKTVGHQVRYLATFHITFAYTIVVFCLCKVVTSYMCFAVYVRLLHHICVMLCCHVLSLYYMMFVLHVI